MKIPHEELGTRIAESKKDMHKCIACKDWIPKGYCLRYHCYTIGEGFVCRDCMDQADIDPRPRDDWR